MKLKSEKMGGITMTFTKSKGVVIAKVKGQEVFRAKTKREIMADINGERLSDELIDVRAKEWK